MATTRLTDTPMRDLLRGGAAGGQNQLLVDNARASSMGKIDLQGYEKLPVNRATGRYSAGMPASAPAVAPAGMPTGTAATTSATNLLRDGARVAVGRDIVGGPQQPVGRLAKAGNLATRVAPGLAAAGSAMEDAPAVSGVLADRNATGIDKTAAASGLVGKAAATGAGVGIGTNLGVGLGAMTGPAAPVMMPLLGLAGGALGGWGANKLAGSALDAGNVPGFDSARPAATAPQPTGYNFPTNSRGKNFDDPRRLDLDPSRQTLGPSRDFTNELASVPAQLPADMRDGVIFSTKGANGVPVFSGRNVGANAQMVDGKGATLRQGGTMSVMPGMSKEKIAEIMGRPLPAGMTFNPGMSAAQNLQYNREVAAAQQRNEAGRIIENQSGGGLRGGAAQNGGTDGMAALRRFAGRKDVSLGTLRTLADAEGNFRGQDIDLRGQDIDKAVKTRGQDVDMRGQDMDMTVKENELRAAAAQRGQYADIWKAAGGDAMAAADLAARAGLDPARFTSAASAGQAIDTKAAANAERSLEPFMKADKDGKFSENERARVRNIAESVVPGWMTMSERERQEKAPTAKAALSLITGLNNRRNTGLLQAIGFDGDNPQLTGLPDFGQGAKLSEVSALQGAGTPGGVSRNDYKITMKNGQEVFLPRDAVNQDVLEFLSGLGVDVGKLKK